MKRRQDLAVLGAVSGSSALASVENHTEEIRWSPNGSEVEHEYALFARNGFTDSVREATADRDDLQLFNLKRIDDPIASE